MARTIRLRQEAVGTYERAREIIKGLKDVIFEVGYATIYDFYDAIDKEVFPEDSYLEFGWTSLDSGVTITEMSDNCYIFMPKAVRVVED